MKFISDEAGEEELVGAHTKSRRQTDCCCYHHCNKFGELNLKKNTFQQILGTKLIKIVTTNVRTYLTNL